MCGRSSLRTSKCSGGKATLLDWFTIDDTVLIYTSVYCTSPPSLTNYLYLSMFSCCLLGLSCQNKQNKPQTASGWWIEARQWWKKKKAKQKLHIRHPVTTAFCLNQKKSTRRRLAIAADEIFPLLRLRQKKILLIVLTYRQMCGDEG